MKTLFKGKIFNIVGIPGPASRGEYQVLQHPGAVAILPVRRICWALHIPGSTAVEILLIKQFRPAVGEEIWEAPAGTMDVEGETHKECAERELLEETGYSLGQCGEMIFAGETFSSPGVMTERIKLFFAYQPLLQTQPEAGIEIKWIPFAEIPCMVRDGTIKDAKTIALLMYLTIAGSK